MSDEDLFIALVLAGTAAGSPTPVQDADGIIVQIQQLRLMRGGKLA
jgi:hypothetical protein